MPAWRTMVRAMSLLSIPVEPTQAEAVYRQLKTTLMTGARLPGERLSIRKLAEELGAGTSPVREALKRLASERVLVSSLKRSYAVPILDRKRAADLFNLRALLECEAAAQAIEGMDAATISALEEAIARMQEAVLQGRHDAYTTENHGFHFLIYNRCGNPDMIAVIEQLWMQTGPSLRRGLETTRPDPEWRQAHDMVVRALHDGDPDALRACLLRDIRWEWLDDHGVDGQ